jgi:hypothetical protein
VGVDFITRCTSSFERSWDRARTELLGPDLFRRHLELGGRTYLLSPEEGSNLREGDGVLLQWREGILAAFQDRTCVGVVTHPPSALRTAVERAGGVLCARIERVHLRSRAADISVIL